MIEYISTHATLIGLVFFVTFFALVVAWLLRPGAKTYYDAQAEIPLKGDDNDQS